MTRIKITDSPQSEFWFHVASQSEIPIAGQIESIFDFNALNNFIKKVKDSDAQFNQILKEELKNNIDLVDILRTLVGVSNKRLYLELSLLFGKTKIDDTELSGISGDSIYNLNKHDVKFFKKICMEQSARGELGLNKLVNYLSEKGLRKIILALVDIEPEILKHLVESLIFPKEIQQKEAKRRGHGAEQALAIVLNRFDLIVTPEDRHSDPMRSKDPSVSRESYEIVPKKTKDKTWSFDLIISKGVHKIFVQSLIHTSDPGQYGVNKSDETGYIKNEITEFNLKNEKNCELWGLVDGFGFSENKKDTIDKMLLHFDCFIQMASLYKAPLHLHKLGAIALKAIRFDENYYSEEQIKDLAEKYVSDDIEVLNFNDNKEKNLTAIEAGKAIVYF